MTKGTYGEVSFLGLEVVFGRVDQLSLIFSYVFSIMALLGMIYALHVEHNSQHVTALTYAGGALGVTFAGDFHLPLRVLGTDGDFLGTACLAEP